MRQCARSACDMCSVWCSAVCSASAYAPAAPAVRARPLVAAPSLGPRRQAGRPYRPRSGRARLRYCTERPCCRGPACSAATAGSRAWKGDEAGAAAWAGSAWTCFSAAWAAAWAEAWAAALPEAGAAIEAATRTAIRAEAWAEAWAAALPEAWAEAWPRRGGRRRAPVAVPPRVAARSRRGSACRQRKRSRTARLRPPPPRKAAGAAQAARRALCPRWSPTGAALLARVQRGVMTHAPSQLPPLRSSAAPAKAQKGGSDAMRSDAEGGEHGGGNAEATESTASRPKP